VTRIYKKYYEKVKEYLTEYIDNVLLISFGIQ